MQRAGRAARAAGRVGLAVLLVEPSVYTTILNEHGEKPKTSSENGSKNAKSAKKKQATSPIAKPSSEDTKAKRNYAIARGVQRGGPDISRDVVLVRDCPAIDAESADEGLLSLVQSGTCRRDVLTDVYGNKPARECLFMNS